MKFSIFKTKDFECNVKVLDAKFYCGIGLTLLAFIALQVMGASIRANLVLTFALFMLALLEIKCNEKLTRILNILWATASAFALFYLPQFLLKLGVGELGNRNIILGILITASVILFIYICTRNIRVSVITSFVLLMALAVVNYYVVRFRGEELSPADFLAIGTAANVASEYEFFGDVTLVYFLCIIVIFCFAGFCIPNFKEKFKIKNSLIMAAVEAVMLVVIAFGVSKVNTQFFMICGTQFNGFYVNFLSKLKMSTVERPAEYDEQFMEEMEAQYGGTSASETDNLPDIIMIMVEAFGDLRVMGDLHTDSEVMPFYDSLNENSIKGKAIVSVYGGGTCNSEFEALTGHSMSNLPLKTYPYQQYVRQDIWSMASHLRSLGYETMATHPEQSVNWMRDRVYTYLGFDEAKFIEAYPQENLVRGHVSDQEMYEQMISWYEEQKEDVPLFYFGVTMQNHSPYTYSEGDFSSQVHLEGYSQEYPEVEQYLSLTQYSDQALKYLVEYFETVENDVVIVFFGDHMPQLDSFYEEMNGGPLDTLEDEMNKRTVPFAIWANYDIEEQNVEYTSLNYLSNFICEAAGIELPAYNKVLEEMRQRIPAISAFGYFSAETGKFAVLDDMNEEEKNARMVYSSLQYNALFDDEHNSQVFFPLQNKN